MIMNRKLIMPLPGILFCFLLFASCNNGETDKKSEKDTTSIKNPNTEVGMGLLPPLPTYKITRDQLISIDNITPAIKKLIIHTGFDKISDPATLKVYMYNSASHRDYARNTPAVLLDIDPSAMANNVPDKFIISNNEIDFREIRKELKHGNTWDTDFTHIRLRAKVITAQNQSYLVYALEVMNENQLVSAKVVPAESNPSPPKPPVDEP